MTALSVDELLERLERSLLLDADRLAAVKAELEPIRHEIDPEAYTRRLVKEGTLTQWQVDGLFAGRKRFVLGNYRLLDQIGRGGMGAVFKAEHVRLKRLVALKVMAPELMDRPEQVARFQKEIQAAAALDSPHVVRAIDAEQIGKSHLLVMELVEGEPVERIVRRRGRLPAGEACEYIRQAAVGLQHAHECGMVHRDIKPGNLIHTWSKDEPLIKVFDLGLARFVSERVDKSEMTRTGQVMGTPDYMSPEQGWDTKTVDIRGDIYSLGCSLFRMITGRVPFSGDNPLQTLMVRCSTDAPLIRTYLPEVDESLERVIAKMLARDPAQRYQTPGEVAEALGPFAEIVGRKEFGKRESERLEPVDRPDSEARSETISDGETGYEQFLNANSDRTQPDPLSTGLVQPSNVGAPTVSIEGLPPAARAASTIVTSEKTAGSRHQQKRTAVVAGAAVAAILIAGVVWAVLPGQEDGKRNDSPGTVTKKWEFEPLADCEVDEGEELRFKFQLKATEGGLQKPRLQLAGEEVEGLSLDSSTGEVVWTPREAHGPGRFPVTVNALLQGEEKPVAEQTVTVTVNEVDRPPVIEPVAAQRVEAGDELSLQVEASDPDEPAFGLRYRLAPGAPPGASIDHATGEFRWTPPADHAAGRVPVMVLVTAANAPNLAAAKTFQVDVLVGRPQFKLLDAADQTIAAGSKVQLPLRTSGIGNETAEVLFKLEKSSPAGDAVQAQVDASTGVFVWETAASTKAGRYEFTVRADLDSDPPRSAVTTFAVVVTAPSSTGDTPVASASLPSKEEIEAAGKEARALFRSEIVAARSLQERAKLASRLLNRAKESGDSPLAFVLFDMSRDYGIKSRSVAIALESVRISSGRFGIDPVALTVESVAAYRPKGATWFDRQQVREIGISASVSAVEQNRFAEVETLVKAAENIARQSKDFEVADELKKAEDFAGRLKRETADRTGDEPLSESAQLARSELLGILKRLQFEPAFVSLDNVRFFRHTAGDLPDRGKSLWQVDREGLLMESPMQNSNTGFVDRGRVLTGFTLRMNVAADCSAGMLCIGLPQTGSFEGLRLHLGAGQFCFLRKATGTEFFARPATPVARNEFGWDQVEVRVKSGQITVLVNDKTVIDTSTDAQLNGFLGLDAFLGAAAPARLRLENVRIRAAN